MNPNNNHEINEAFIQGLIGLAAIFFVIKDWINPENQQVFKNLIIFFVLVSLIRVYGVILEFEDFKIISNDLFVVILFPYTVFVGLTILLTEIYPNKALTSIVPAYAWILTTMKMYYRHYGLKFRNY